MSEGLMIKDRNRGGWVREGSKEDGSGGEPEARQLGVEGMMALEVEPEIKKYGGRAPWCRSGA